MATKHYEQYPGGVALSGKDNALPIERWFPSCGRLLTESRAFGVLVERAFAICDDSGDGIVDEAELYAGLVLVHLNLAKYAGPAACYPPTRAVCDELFRIADTNHSGGLDIHQFHWILRVLCAQILARMFVYYVVLILAVPVLANGVMANLHIPKDTYSELFLQQGLSCGVFFLAIPLLWNAIDDRYSKSQERNYQAADNAKVVREAEDVLPLPSKREEQRQRRRKRRTSTLQQQFQVGSREMDI